MTFTEYQASNPGATFGAYLQSQVGASAAAGGNIGTGIGGVAGFGTSPTTAGSPSAGTSAPGNPTATPGNPTATNTGSLIADLKHLFPWLTNVGFTTEFFQELVAGSASDAEMLAKIRNAPEYKKRFPALWRSDGSMRMNEAQYVAQEASYRNLLNQFGFADKYDQANPASLIGFFDSDIAPDELRDRLGVYQQVRDGGQAQKDAFYVYGGMSLTDDDLYAAVIDPAARQKLFDEYNQRVASTAFDYTTWITRATEVGLSRVAQTLGSLKTTGALTGTAVQAILRTDPTFARTIMDALYTGGGASTPTLNLSELLSTFEYAAIGAAASNAGLTLPTKARIMEIRSAGIDRARATSVYSQYGSNRGLYDSIVRRSGGGEFGQEDFESAAFLGDAAEQARLATGIAREDAAGQQQGAFRFSESSSGRLAQRGYK